MKYKKILLGIAAGGLAAGTAYLIYKKYMSRDTQQETVDEGFSDDRDESEPLPKRILVLGLDQSGKSCLLSALSQQTPSEMYQATEGFNVITVQNERAKNNLDIWEIGGGPNVRKYWPHFIQDTEVLVFVVDSTDRKRFPQAYDEMHKLLGEPRLEEKPVIVLANKQDLSNAADMAEIKEALGLEDVKHHRVKIVGTSITTTPPKGIDEVKQLLTRI